MITIRDVARESGVSIATVSNVLTGSARPVSAGVRTRVLSAAKKLNYHPNAVAQALVRRRVDAIGVLSGIFTATDIVVNSYAAGVMAGILQAASAAEQNIVLFTSEWQGASRSLSLFRDRRADGLVLISPPATSDLVVAVSSLGIPFVTVGTAQSGGVISVDVDDNVGASMAMAHLADMGHRRIAHIHGNMDMSSAPARLKAYVESVARLHLESPPGYMIGAAYSGSGTDAACHMLLSRLDRPTAIFAGNDNIAVAAIRAATAMGLQVPRDLSIVGYDDAPIAELLTPALTTIRQPLRDIGAMAVRILMSVIEGSNVEATEHRLKPELIVRQSTAAPPREA